MYYLENEELVIDVHVIKKYGTAAILWSFYRKKRISIQYAAVCCHLSPQHTRLFSSIISLEKTLKCMENVNEISMELLNSRQKYQRITG